MVVVVPSAQGNAGQLESYTQSTPGLQVEIIRAFEIGRDWHGCALLVACQAGAQSVSQPSVPDCGLLLANDGNSIRRNQHLTSTIPVSKRSRLLELRRYIGPRSHRGRWRAGSDRGERWSSRSVATAERRTPETSRRLIDVIAVSAGRCVSHWPCPWSLALEG